MHHLFPQARRVAAFAAFPLMFWANLAGAQKILPEGIKDLATQIATNVAKEQKQKIAVLPFRELDGRSTILSSYISEQLVTDLFTIGGLEIVERAMLDKLLGELKLSETGLVDPETAKKVGKVAGVDAIVTGSITDFQSYVALNCRLIDTQTGRIFGAAQTRIVKDDDLRKIMGTQPAPAPTEAAKPEPDRPATVEAKVAQRQQVQGVLFELKSCRLSGTTVECELLMTSKTEEQEISFSAAGSRLVDEEGIEYRADRVATRERMIRTTIPGYSSQATRLSSGIPLRRQITFEEVSPDIRKGALIELLFHAARSRKEFRVEFRDVPLTRE